MTGPDDLSAMWPQVAMPGSGHGLVTDGPVTADSSVTGAQASDLRKQSPVTDVTVCDAPPDGLLDRVRDALTRYVILPSAHDYVAVTLWIVGTHGQKSFQSAPRLIISSPEKRCGKSRLLDVIEALSYKPLIAFNVTVSALFRSIDPDDPPTLLLDEADAIWSSKKSGDASAEDLRALINAGFGRGRPAIRCVGPQQTPTAFATFAMVAAAGIGGWAPDTVTDRGIRLTLRRRAAHEHVDQFRHRRDVVPLHELRDVLTAWIHSHLDELADAEPLLPVEDRAADTWEPLIAIADLAGGAWPQLARDAATALCAEADSGDTETSLGVRLLSDCRDIFTGQSMSAISSDDLVRHLRGIEEAPWGSFELTQRDLSRRLRQYGIKPDRVRPDGGAQARGYRLADFTDAFSRYLSDPSAGPSQSVTPVTGDCFRRSEACAPVTDESAVTGPSVTQASRAGADGPGGVDPDSVVVEVDSAANPANPDASGEAGDPVVEVALANLTDAGTTGAVVDDRPTAPRNLRRLDERRSA